MHETIAIAQSLMNVYIYKIKRVTESGQQGIKTRRLFLLYSDSG